MLNPTIHYPFWLKTISLVLIAYLIRNLSLYIAVHKHTYTTVSHLWHKLHGFDMVCSHRRYLQKHTKLKTYKKTKTNSHECVCLNSETNAHFNAYKTILQTCQNLLSKTNMNIQIYKQCLGYWDNGKLTNKSSAHLLLIFSSFNMKSASILGNIRPSSSPANLLSSSIAPRYIITRFFQINLK